MTIERKNIKLNILIYFQLYKLLTSGVLGGTFKRVLGRFKTFINMGVVNSFLGIFIFRKYFFKCS